MVVLEQVEPRAKEVAHKAPRYWRAASAQRGDVTVKVVVSEFFCEPDPPRYIVGERSRTTMIVEVGEGISWREIHVLVHACDLIPACQLAWRTVVPSWRLAAGERRGACGGRQSERAFDHDHVAAFRRTTRCGALRRGGRHTTGLAAGSAVLFLSAQRESQKRSHRQCCTPIPHVFPPELLPSNAV